MYTFYKSRIRFLRPVILHAMLHGNAASGKIIRGPIHVHPSPIAKFSRTPEIRSVPVPRSTSAFRNQHSYREESARHIRIAEAEIKGVNM